MSGNESEELIVGHNWSVGSSDISDITPTFASYQPRDHGQSDSKRPLLQPLEKRHFYGAKFRYIIAFIITASTICHNYLNRTLPNATIGMVSSDVLQAGLTQLRANIPTSGEPYNVAAPGTCPVVAKRTGLINEEDAIISNTSYSGPTTRAEASQPSKDLLLIALQAALVHDVRKKVENGDLVDWNIQQRTWILSAAHIGRFFGDIACNTIGLRYSAKNVFAAGLVSATFRALLFPTIVSYTPYGVAVSFELVMGALSNCSFSSYLRLLSAWFLPDEAQTIVGLNYMCFLVAPALSGFISTQFLVFNLGWSICFYSIGILLLAVTISWLLMATDQPEHNTFVTVDELVILEESLANTRVVAERVLAELSSTSDCCCDPSDFKCPGKRMVRAPKWIKLITCPTIWALTATQFAGSWLSHLTSLWPTFLANILHANNATISLLMALRGVVTCIYCTAIAFLTRKLPVMRPYGISLTAYRRASLALMTLCVCGGLLLIVVFDCSIITAALVMIIVPIAGGFELISTEQMPLDISPDDSSLISATSRTLSAPSSIISPLITGEVLALADQSSFGSRNTWRLLWLLTIAIHLLAAAWFVVFARAEPQSYSDLKPAGKCKSKQFSPYTHTKRYQWHLDDRRYV